MPQPGRLIAVEHAIVAAPGHTLVEVLADTLGRDCGADQVEVLLADYRLTVLLPVLDMDAGPTPIANTPAGRAFATQAPVVLPAADDRRATVYLPVTLCGDRMGALRLRLPGPPDEAELLALRDVARVFAHVLASADRDTDRYLLARRRHRLTLAAEMQWQLMPGRACVRDEFTLAGQLEPAYAVGGDNYDWSAGTHNLTLTVSNGMGRGVTASLLTHLGVSALRNARRAGADLADQAALADQAVYGQHGGRSHLSTVLIEADLRTGRALAIDAGSPSVLRVRDGVVSAVELEPQLPLGMFDGTHYHAQEITLAPGDRLLVVGQGVLDACSPENARYGDSTMRRTARATSRLDAHETVRELIRDLIDYHQGQELTDDAVVVCLDWHGTRG